MNSPSSTFSRAARRACGALGALLALGAGAQQPDAAAPAPAPLKHSSSFSGAWISRVDPFGASGAMHAPAPFGAPAPGRARPAMPMPMAAPSAPGDFVQLQQPAALAARANIIYLADAGRRQIYRYDVGPNRLSVLAPYAGGAAANIALAPDFSLYVAEAGGALAQYGVDGRLLRRFGQGLRELGRPVAIALDESGARLAVADSLYRHVVVLSTLGQVIAVYQPDEAQSVEGMVRGPDGLYLLDRLGRRVVVIGWDGAPRYTLGEEGELKLPGALAVDRHNRVFVRDNADHTIKVFVDGRLAGSYAGERGPGFGQISAMTVDQNQLYVADALNAQVQTLRIAPPRRAEQP
jgi:hypothetical protein